MVDDNLFLALKKYTPGPNKDPREDFLTEAFAWVLRQHDDLAVKFLWFVVDQHEGDFSVEFNDKVRWQTQKGNGKVRLDMVADFGNKAIIFEHKIWSPLGENQIGRYRKYGLKRWEGGVLVVLITPRRSQHGQEPDVALIWSQVFRLVKRWLDDQDNTPQMVEHFLGLLRAEGLGPPAPMSHESILAYFPGQKLEPSLRTVVKRALRDDWSWFYARTPWVKGKQEPYLRWGRGERHADGRLGLDLLKSWRPGIFVGVLLDGTDHKVKPSAPHLGPDFSLILSYHVSGEQVPAWDDFASSDEFQRLRARLSKGLDGWDVLDHLKEHKRPNKWHPIHIRRPLLEVMQGTQTVDEQVERFITASREVLDFLMAGGELEAFKDRWEPTLSSQS